MKQAGQGLLSHLTEEKTEVQSLGQGHTAREGLGWEDSSLFLIPQHQAPRIILVNFQNSVIQLLAIFFPRCRAVAHPRPPSQL